MDGEPNRKRPTPARDSLDILRRVEPVLLRVASDVVSLRQGAADLVASVGSGGGQGGAESARQLSQLSRDLDRLSEAQAQVSRSLDQLRDGRDGALLGQERLHAGQSDLLQGLARLRDQVVDHNAATASASDAVCAHLQRLGDLHQGLDGDREAVLGGQRALAGLVLQLDERLRAQARELRSVRRELRFLPVLWSLAALIFALAGAVIVVLRVRLS